MKESLKQINKGYLTALGATLLAWTLAAIPKVPKWALGLDLSDTAVLSIRVGLAFFVLALLGLVGWLLFIQTRRKLRSVEQQLADVQKRPHRFQDDYFLDEKFPMYHHKTKPGFFCVACAAEKSLETPMIAAENDWGWNCPIESKHFVPGPGYKSYTPVMTPAPWL
jgi:hypothetical protein